MTIDPETYQREIVELHAFFEAWFNGDLPNTAASFARFENAMADSFTMHTPDGESVDREQILQRVRGGHGSARERGPMRIWIENVSTLEYVDADTQRQVVVYEEWQQSTPDGLRRGRRSRAVFVRATDAPNGVAWVDLREEWIDQSAGDDAAHFA